MSSIFNEQTKQKIPELRDITLKIAVVLFIVSVILGAFLILAGNETTGKLLGTSTLLAVTTLACVNNFHCLESDDKKVQNLALIGLISNIIHAILWTLMIWEVFGFHTTCYYKCTGDNYFILGKLTVVASILAVLGLCLSNIFSIKEFKNKAITALKWTAISGIGYCGVFFIIFVFSGFQLQPSVSGFVLAGFLGFVGLLAWIIADRISINEGKNLATTQAQPQVTQPTSVASVPPRRKTDDELRAEIEEQVRREMIEKEVRARLEKEQSSHSSE